MGRIYNVTLDAFFPTSGSSNAALSYNVNWDSIMPQGAYKMTWSYMSDANSAITDAYVMGLALPLGGNDSFCVKGNYTGSTTFIGFTELKEFGTTSYYMFANQNTNPPLYLQQRPNQNTILVQHCNGVDTNSTFSNPIPVAYVLTLCFEAIDHES